MDLLDILEGRYNQTYTGRYYAKLPTPSLLATGAAPVYFDYEIVDPYSYQYTRLLGNIIDTDSASVTIMTRSSDISRSAVNKHIALQDGRLYLVTSVTEDPRSISREAARLMIVPRNVDKILRLKEVEDPWGIGGAAV